MKKTSTIYRSCKHPFKLVVKNNLSLNLYALVTHPHGGASLTLKDSNHVVRKHKDLIVTYILNQAKADCMSVGTYLEDAFKGYQIIPIMDFLFFGESPTKLVIQAIETYMVSEVISALTEAVGQAKRDAEVKAVAAANRKDNARMMRRLNHA